MYMYIISLCYAPAICPSTPPPHTHTLHLGLWNTEDDDVSIYKAQIYSLYFWDVLNVTPLLTVPTHHHVPKCASVLVDLKPDISKALQTQTKNPICHCYHRYHRTVVSNDCYMYPYSNMDPIQNWYLYRTV